MATGDGRRRGGSRSAGCSWITRAEDEPFCKADLPYRQMVAPRTFDDRQNTGRLFRRYGPPDAGDSSMPARRTLKVYADRRGGEHRNWNSKAGRLSINDATTYMIANDADTNANNVTLKSVGRYYARRRSRCRTLTTSLSAFDDLVADLAPRPRRCSRTMTMSDGTRMVLKEVRGVRDGDDLSHL